MIILIVLGLELTLEKSGRNLWLDFAPRDELNQWLSKSA